MPKSLRLFIASPLDSVAGAPMIALSKSLRTQLEQLSQPPNLRWVPPDQWHLTWLFLGQTPEEKIPALQAGLNAALTGKHALITHWEQLSWWPSRHRPKILVGQLQTTPDLLAVNDAILSLWPEKPTKGSPTQKMTQSHKPFNPHITLARFKDRGPAHRYPLPALPAVDTPNPPGMLDEVTLFRSELNSAGAIHTPLHTVKLPVSPIV